MELEDRLHGRADREDKRGDESARLLVVAFRGTDGALSNPLKYCSPMPMTSDLPARLGLKDGHSSRLFEARGLYFRWPQPMRKYINVFGR